MKRSYPMLSIKTAGSTLTEQITKGFYQPVYAFSVVWDDLEGTINIPAIKK